MRILLAVLAFFICTAWSGSWQEGSIVGAPTDNAKWPRTIWADNISAWKMPALGALPPATWITIDLTNGPQWVQSLPPAEENQHNLPADVKAITLNVLLIVTNASGANCQVYATFRAPGSTHNGEHFQLQTLAGIGQGARTNGTIVVPVVARKFQFYWNHDAWPGCSVAVNASIQGYLR